MDHSPFSAKPPDWVEAATHSTHFKCPRCGNGTDQSKAVWINRRSPVYIEGMYRRKWQEFYHCDCEASWWGWSSDRPTPEWLQARNARLREESSNAEPPEPHDL